MKSRLLKNLRRGYLSGALACGLVFPGGLVVLEVSAAPPAGYYLVWADEFSGASLDTTKWYVWAGPNRDAVNVAGAVTVGGGYLTITTYTANGTHYSGIISSDALFRYGYYESSVEFNGSPGMWSAFWLQSPTEGELIGDPAASGAEIDVCEHRVTDTGDADNISGMVQTSVHWDGYGGDEQTSTSGLIGSGLGTGFHTYGWLWNNTNYSFSFDGVQLWSTNAGLSAHTEMILFSSEVQSNYWAGIVPAAGYGSFLTSTTTMVVDYIRYYAPTSTVFWTGASSANWATAGNWLSNTIPTSASDVVLSFLSVGNFSLSLGQNTTVNSLSIEETSASVSIAGNALTLNSGGLDMLSAVNNATINSALVLGAPQSWNIGEFQTLTVNGVVSGAGNLTLNGWGTVILAATNTCSGSCTVSNGTLLVNGMMTNPVTVAGGKLGGGGVLGGVGTISGPVWVNSGGTLSLGPSIGTLTLSNTLTLQPGSLTSLAINKSAGTCDRIIGLASIAYGGTLAVTNQAGTLAARDAFKLFDAKSYSGAFARINPLMPGTGLAWDTSTLTTDGTLRVMTTNMASVAALRTGNGWNLSWPADHIGWLLQGQTNPMSVGLTTNWTAVPGSTTTNHILVTIDAAVGSAFFRLASPWFTTYPFISGDLMVLEVFSGSSASAGASGWLSDYVPSGVSTWSQADLPFNGASSLVFGGSAYEGALSLSADGQTVVVAGFNVPSGSSATTIDSSSTTGSAAVPRAVGSVNAAGTFTLSATTTQFSGGTIRSAVTDGAGNFWAGGGNSGIVYLGSNSPPATISTVSTATRVLGLVNGSLYFTETGSGHGVMAFSGAPRTTATPVMVLSTDGTGIGTPSPKGFAFNTNLTIAYVADNRTAANGGGIQRFNWNGSSWAYAYTLGYTLSASQEVWDMTVDFSGPHPIIYAITGESEENYLVSVTDTGSGSAFTILDMALADTAFRGVAFAPEPAAR